MPTLRPPMNSNQRTADDKGYIDPAFFQYHRALHDVVAAVATVPADSGSWPASAAALAPGSVTLWRNGTALRLYANVNGTLRYLSFT